jgi:hypothetical protein
MDDEIAGRLQRGQPVKTLSGVRLGSVDKVLAREFELVTDTWSLRMAKECIYLVDHGVVTLVCESEGLPSYVRSASRRRPYQS